MNQYRVVFRDCVVEAEGFDDAVRRAFERGVEISRVEQETWKK